MSNSSQDSNDTGYEYERATRGYYYNHTFYRFGSGPLAGTPEGESSHSALSEGPCNSTCILAITCGIVALALLLLVAGCLIRVRLKKRRSISTDHSSSSPSTQEMGEHSSSEGHVHEVRISSSPSRPSLSIPPYTSTSKPSTLPAPQYHPSSLHSTTTLISSHSHSSALMRASPTPPPYTPFISEKSNVLHPPMTSSSSSSSSPGFTDHDPSNPPTRRPSR
ncbi:MAG: hypothetical protein DHS80DRAFT_29012 [Piptocephalis tieghemiana]|nr:MAG: hypothetical protein DHS80DRAFT_29012 [Piptocephalis tieghemiana]